MTTNKLKSKILKKIDQMTSYTEKLEYLNAQFLKAKSSDEAMILDMIEQLKFWGR